MISLHHSDLTFLSVLSILSRCCGFLTGFHWFQLVHLYYAPIIFIHLHIARMTLLFFNPDHEKINHPYLQDDGYFVDSSKVREDS